MYFMSTWTLREGNWFAGASRPSYASTPKLQQGTRELSYGLAQLALRPEYLRNPKLAENGVHVSRGD